MIYKLKNSKRGMTLVEMVISLVILSILMTSTMGMIVSSNTLFISTSQSALDKRVGNSVYTLIESVLKYSTRLTISSSAKPESTAQSMYINVTDSSSNSGTIQFRGKMNDDGTAANYVSLYDPSFYNGRTIQYSITEVGSDQKHVRIAVNVYREKDPGGAKELVYTKDAVIKCLNLALIRSNSNQNTIDSSGVSADSVNQYLYFTIDEKLIAGGDTAWSLEYKINEYLERYNAILARYYADLCTAQEPLYDAIGNDKTQAVTGKRIQYSVMQTLLSERETSINTLRTQYQQEIYDLLHFTPTKAITATSNPYYHVVATKEELYAGFMLEYYDANKDGKISKSEYPAFEEDDFFAGTTLNRYNGSDNGVKILAYFNDYLNDDYTSLFGSHSQMVFYYTELAASLDKSRVSVIGSTGSLGAVSIGDVTTETYTKGKNMTGGVFYSFRKNAGGLSSEYFYRYDGNGSSSELGTYASATKSWGSYQDNCTMSYGTAFNQVLYGEGNRPALSGIRSITTVASVTSEDNTKMPTDSSQKGSRLVIKPYTDVKEGWYYYQEDNSMHVFFLEADPENNEGLVAVAKNSTDYDSQIWLYSYNYKIQAIVYTQAKYSISDDLNSGSEVVNIYDFNKHQYKDWILYGVDWNSWFKASQDGLLNKVIGGISGLFTNRTNINEINGSNAYMSLGLQGQYNVNNIDRKLASYNLAWVVYNPNRGTWYYLPDSSNRVSSAMSGITWISNKNTPVPLDLTGWPSSTAMVKDIDTRKLSSKGFFNLIDTTSDKIWVPLPTGSTINREDITG